MWVEERKFHIHQVLSVDTLLGEEAHCVVTNPVFSLTGNYFYEVMVGKQRTRSQMPPNLADNALCNAHL